MKHCTAACLIFVTTILCHFCPSTVAQTLNEKLLAEDPKQLAHQAMQDGDIVRGAILFHQGNINCAKCHRPSAEKDRIGPDLAKLDTDTTSESIIESILLPSKTIREGYETIVVLTVDGQTINGTKVSEDDEKLVVRDSKDVDKLITIARDDLEGVRPGTTSSMPEDLANELKNRQQFLDLLRYVIDIKERGPEASQQIAQARVRRELSPELSGHVLIQQLNCAACHQADSMQSPVAAKKSPRLSWSAKHLNPDYLESFVANPHGVKPGTTMPDMFGESDESSRKAQAISLTQFLLSEFENDFQYEAIDFEAVPRGFESFQSVGCVACHSPRDESSIENFLEGSTPLGDLSRKYNVSGLTQFLEDPQAARPSGHMPNMQLAHREAIDISNYLLQSAKKSDEFWEPNSELVKQGEEIFIANNCAKCHDDVVDQRNELTTYPALDKLNSEMGCLSGETGDWPTFQLMQQQKESIQAALRQPRTNLTSKQKIEVSLQTFNCVACHDRGDFGGISSLRNPHFKTTNLNLGDQGRLPPTLTGVGAKLKPKWMRDVLVNQRSIRPYMKTRMPQYGEENVGHLIELFRQEDRLSDTTFAKFDDQKAMRETGHRLAGNRGLNCVACHTYKFNPSDTMPAVDLTEMADRLEKDWFYQYMLEPQTFSPNTVMPSFWPGGRAIRTDVEGTPEEQVEALWQYLIDGRQANAPSGVVREPLEIVVTDEARMLRRSYPGIGKRGIGVGYPGGVNLAFDAEQLRLGSIWKGKFADPSGVWKGQGSGRVRAMGKVIEFAKGPEFDDGKEPWVVDDQRPPDHQFKGYVLDKSQRPTFRYSYDEVEVEDFFQESKDDETDGMRLQRKVTFNANESRDNLSFRIAADATVTESNGVFSIGDRLKVRVLSDHAARLVQTGQGGRLEVPIDLDAEIEEQLVIEYSWD